jgi:hypothetical protein
MNFLPKNAQSLPTAHKEALLWFHERTDQVISWPAPLQSGIFLVNKAKGIHKPAGSEYALSVRESLNGPYPDREPSFRSDGSWTYPYFQEQPDPNVRDSRYTNRALLACQRDEIPVGVIRQVEPRPNPKYKVLGLAMVSDWKDGYFLLEGLKQASRGAMLYPTAIVETVVEAFDPAVLEDTRVRTRASIVKRQGQGKFRSSVLSAYEHRCAITGCDVLEALEAAHIFPYLGPRTNLVVNGLLLRSDLHTLYDLGLIAIDPTTMRVLIAPRLHGTTHRKLASSHVRLPRKIADHPSLVALEMQLKWAQSTWRDLTCVT